MPYRIKYRMMTGASERETTSEDEAAQIVESLKATGARPITVEYEDETGQRHSLLKLGFGDVAQPEIAIRKPSSSTPATAKMDRRIDPSLHSISLADARRDDCPLIFVNKGFERLTGYTREQVIGRNCRLLQGPDTARHALNQMREAIARKEPVIVDLLNYRRDGTSFWNRVSLRPVLDVDGQLTHIIGIQSDITRLLSLQDDLESWARDLARSR